MTEPPGRHPVTVTVGDGEAEPGAPVPPSPIPADFAGLSFEVGPLVPGNAGVRGYLFRPGNTELITLFHNTGLGNLRVGGGSVDQRIPAGTGPDGFTGIDNLFGFAAAAGLRVIYTLRLLSRADAPIDNLIPANARIAGYIWSRYREHLASFAIGNEPDWHAFHSHAGHLVDPAIVEDVPGVPGSAYRSYLARWQAFADAVTAAAPGAPLSGPDTGDYTTGTYSPDPGSGRSWTERFTADGPARAAVTDITQHYYAGADPKDSTAAEAIGSMLSPEWVTGTLPGSQPAGTSYVPYPWLYRSNLAAVTAAGLRYRLTESNDYLGGVPGASNAFAAALWALDHLHWWAAHGAAGVNFHNKQWLYTDTIVPAPAGPAAGCAVSPKAYGIKAFALGSAGHSRPVRIGNPDGINVTAYCAGRPVHSTVDHSTVDHSTVDHSTVADSTAGDGTAHDGAAGEDCVTIVNKTYGEHAADAAVTITMPGPGPRDAEVITLDSGDPGDVTSATATLGGAGITGDAPWAGTWRPLATGAGPGITLTVPAATAAVVRIRSRR
jgi:hypothetical protein